MGNRCFDRIAIVDWSAASTPKLGADSIWIAVVDESGSEISNVPTRHDAVAVMAGFDEPGVRTLLGVDFSLGFPAGTAAALGLGAPSWRAAWELLGTEIYDDGRNANNRFEVASRLNARLGDGAGPFWGCPPARATATLTTTKPVADDGWPGQWRVVEQRLRARGHRPFSAWQLLGAGAVGSQSLMGVAALERLRRSLVGRMALWPFDTGFDSSVITDPTIIVAEVWPSLWPLDVPTGMCKDAAQVEVTAHRLFDLDTAGELHALFSPEVSAGLMDDVLDEEGWVLGVR